MALCLKVIQLENYKGINYVQQDLQYSKLKKTNNNSKNNSGNNKRFQGRELMIKMG